jgi:hypothetical protein
MLLIASGSFHISSNAHLATSASLPLLISDVSSHLFQLDILPVNILVLASDLFFSQSFNCSLLTFFSSASSFLIDDETDVELGVFTIEETSAQVVASNASSGIFSINAIIVYIIC